MKKQSLFFMPLFALFAQNVLAQNLSFTRFFGGDRYDDARGLVALSDGSLVFTGLAKSGADSLGTMFLTKTNAAGAEIWTKHFDREREDGGNHLLATRDGGFLISGHTALSYGELCDGYLVKTDAVGNELWRALVGGAGDDVCNAAIEMDDGSFLVVGRTEDAVSHTFRVLFARIDANGNQVFMKQLGGEQACLAYKIAKSSDGNLLIAGFDYFTDGRFDEMMVAKFSQEGAVLWQFSFENSMNSRVYQIVPLADGGGIAIGGVLGADGTFQKTSFFTFDTDGQILAEKLVPENGDRSWIFDAAMLADGSFVGCGTIILKGQEAQMPLLFHFTRSLEILESISLDIEGGSARALAICPDGNFALAGHRTKMDGPRDIYLQKLAGFGENANLVDVETMPFLLFPNPISERAYLKIGEGNEPKILTVSDADGRVLRENRFEAAEFFIEKNGLPSGFVFFSVKNEVGKTLKSGRILIPD